MFGRFKYGSWTLKQVGDHWNKVEDYDDINEETYSYFQRFVDGLKFSNFKQIKSNAKVLDVCSRTGNGSLYFSKVAQDPFFVCMDVTDRMMQICTEALTKEKVKHEMRKFESHELPAKNEEFDYIICFETLEHIPKPDLFVKELFRVLKPEGEIVITTPNILWEPIHWFAYIFDIHHSEGPHRFLTRKEIKKILSEAGFKILSENTTILIPAGPDWLTSFGRKLEKILGRKIMHLLGLRRIFICKKNGEKLD